MRCSLAYFLIASPLLAQLGRPEPQQAPIDALIQSYQSAYSNGRYGEAAANRDRARALLSQIPANDPQFANWAQRVSGIYENGGFGAQARDVLDQALARAAVLGDQSAARVALLTSLANSWQQDRNSLKALSYTEQAVAADEAQSSRTAQQPASASASPWFSASTGGNVTVFRGDYFAAGNGGLYQRLFNLYKELGRPQDASAVLTRVAAHVKNSDGLLASLYQQQGQTDDAAAIYKRQAAQADNPQLAANALQNLASLYQGKQRYADAVSALQEAIGKLETSSDPATTQRAVGIRQGLANMLQQAGQVDAADEVYRQLMAGETSQQVGVVTSYVNFLATTNRADQAEALLKNYQADHANAEPWERNNLWMMFANVEQRSGNTKLAEEYQRRAFASQPQSPAAENRIMEKLQHAQQSANAGRLDEAFNLTLQALDSAPGAVDRESAPWMASLVAGNLAAKAPAKSDEIYRRALGLAEAFSQITVTPLVGVLQSYAMSLASQRRWGDFEQIMERYKVTLSEARGEGTGWMEDVLLRRTENNYRPERLQDALAASQELVKLEESLTGATSERDFNAIRTLAYFMVASGDSEGALPLHRRMVTIADLAYGAKDERRAAAFMSAAMAFAGERQFVEAEELAREAVAVAEQMHAADRLDFANQLRQILQLKQSAQSLPAPKQ